jgi:hypothetical protein
MRRRKPDLPAGEAAAFHAEIEEAIFYFTKPTSMRRG